MEAGVEARVQRGEEDVGYDRHNCNSSQRARMQEDGEDGRGMYRSGELRSSRGAAHSDWPFSRRTTWRDHGRCRQGKSRRRSFRITNEFETLKWCLRFEMGMNPPSCARYQHGPNELQNTGRRTFFWT